MNVDVTVLWRYLVDLMYEAAKALAELLPPPVTSDSMFQAVAASLAPFLQYVSLLDYGIDLPLLLGLVATALYLELGLLNYRAWVALRAGVPW